MTELRKELFFCFFLVVVDNDASRDPNTRMRITERTTNIGKPKAFTCTVPTFL